MKIRSCTRSVTAEPHDPHSPLGLRRAGLRERPRVSSFACRPVTAGSSRSLAGRRVASCGAMLGSAEGTRASGRRIWCQDAISLAAVDLHKHVGSGSVAQGVEILRGRPRRGPRRGVRPARAQRRGKTTTVKAVLGADAALCGQVCMARRPRDEVGYLPENPYFYDYLSGASSCDFCGRLFDMAGDRAERRRARCSPTSA